jgi:hypothetical protein
MKVADGDGGKSNSAYCSHFLLARSLVTFGPRAGRPHGYG